MAGLSPQDARIMDLWDAGHGDRPIALLTGLPLATVRLTISEYYEGDERKRDHASIAAGTAALNAAIASARAAA